MYCVLTNCTTGAHLKSPELLSVFLNSIKYFVMGCNTLTNNVLLSSNF